MRSGGTRSIVAGLVAVSVIAYGGLWQGWLLPGSTHTIEGGYTFDLGDPAQVAGYVDYVFVARVIEEGSRVDDSTFFRLEVVENLKGRVPESVTVTQLGFARGRQTWQLEDQPRFRVGQAYVIAASAPAAGEPAHDVGALGVVGGPLGAIEATTSSLDLMRHGVENRRFPDDLGPETEMLRDLARAEWEKSHLGFASDS